MLLYLLFSLLEKRRSPRQRCSAATFSRCIYSGIQREGKPWWSSTSTDVEPARPDVLELHLGPGATCGATASAAQEGCGGPGATLDPELEGGGSAGETSDTGVDVVVAGVTAGAAVMVDATTPSVEAEGRLLLVLHHVPLFPPPAVG